MERVTLKGRTDQPLSCSQCKGCQKKYEACRICPSRQTDLRGCSDATRLISNIRLARAADLTVGLHLVDDRCRSKSSITARREWNFIRGQEDVSRGPQGNRNPPLPIGVSFTAPSSDLHSINAHSPRRKVPFSDTVRSVPRVGRKALPLQLARRVGGEARDRIRCRQTIHAVRAGTRGPYG